MIFSSIAHICDMLTLSWHRRVVVRRVARIRPRRRRHGQAPAPRAGLGSGGARRGPGGRRFRGVAHRARRRVSGFSRCSAQIGQGRIDHGLGEVFVVSSTVLKRYPCHATAHAAVRAVRDLQAEHGFNGAHVEAITVTGTGRMVERHNILEPADLMLAQYSIPSFGSVVAKSAGDQQPDGVLGERLHWQIPDAEILYLGAISAPPVQRSPTLLFGSL
jgi:hypothetical protein